MPTVKRARPESPDNTPTSPPPPMIVLDPTTLRGKRGRDPNYIVRGAASKTEFSLPAAQPRIISVLHDSHWAWVMKDLTVDQAFLQEHNLFIDAEEFLNTDGPVDPSCGLLRFLERFEITRPPKKEDSLIVGSVNYDEYNYKRRCPCCTRTFSEEHRRSVARRHLREQHELALAKSQANFVGRGPKRGLVSSPAVVQPAKRRKRGLSTDQAIKTDDAPPQGVFVEGSCEGASASFMPSHDQPAVVPGGEIFPFTFYSPFPSGSPNDPPHATINTDVPPTAIGPAPPFSPDDCDQGSSTPLLTKWESSDEDELPVTPTTFEAHICSPEEPSNSELDQFFYEFFVQGCMD